jgi:hypothetical protein
MSEEVAQFVLRFAQIVPCFYRYTFWQNGKSRGGWVASHGLYIKKRGKFFHIFSYTEGGALAGEIKLRRLPHKWFAGLDALMQEK